MPLWVCSMGFEALSVLVWSGDLTRRLLITIDREGWKANHRPRTTTFSAFQEMQTRPQSAEPTSDRHLRVIPTKISTIQRMPNRNSFESGKRITCWKIRLLDRLTIENWPLDGSERGIIDRVDLNHHIDNIPPATHITTLQVVHLTHGAHSRLWWWQSHFLLGPLDGSERVIIDGEDPNHHIDNITAIRDLKHGAHSSLWWSATSQSHFLLEIDNPWNRYMLMPWNCLQLKNAVPIGICWMTGPKRSAERKPYIGFLIGLLIF